MTIRFARTMLAALFFALGLPVAWAADSRLPIGQVDRIQGPASASFDETTRRLRPADPVYLDDRLTTETGARLRVRLNDETEITLGENAELVVDRFVYQPDADTGSLALETLKGAFLFTGGLVESLKTSDVRIVTPVATLGIRGTSAWGGRIDDQYGVFVLDGAVTVATEGGQVSLEAGQGSTITARDAPPGPAKRWPPEKVARAIATVEFPE